MIYGLDLFCGGGGFTRGIEDSKLAIVKYGINHDARAIKTHTLNHPHVKHICEDAESIDPRIFSDKGIDVLIASPECTNHCRAKGNKPYNAQSRATAWQVARYAEFIQPEWIFVENVQEFLKWGPLLDNGRPDPERKGETFSAWLNVLRSLGYNTDYRILCAADYGAYTTRERLFIVASKHHEIKWPKPLFEKKVWKPATDIIDWTIPCPSVFDRKRPLADNTWKRIIYGIEKFWPEPFVAIMKGQSTARSIDSPLPTITTNAHLYLVKPLVILNKWDTKNVRSVEDPLPSLTTIPSLYLAKPFLVKLYGTAKAKPLSVPLDTITAGGNKFGLIHPFITQYNGKSKAHSLRKPINTITTKDRFGLVRPIVKYNGEDYTLDLGYRMLEPHELAAATGFPANFTITGGKVEQRRQIGNAVPPVFGKEIARANLAM